MKKSILLSVFFIALLLTSCGTPQPNKTAMDEQEHTEMNQTQLNVVQPPPTITWSLERDNLIKRFKLQNDKTVTFFMYIFIEGCADPIGYYQVNKVSSVNSQLTNTQQMIDDPNGTMEAGSCVLESPAEDGSYGSNGDAIFGFTPEDIYIESNMKYITSTVPLTFNKTVNRLAIISGNEAQKYLDASKKAMSK